MIRPVSRGMHVLLYVLTALTFFAGTQLFILSEDTDQFFSWTIANPMSAAFIGAGFWGAAVVVFWCARQRAWARGRVVVPTVAVVATMLLVATLQNLESFHGLLGLAWIEVYALFPPILGAITIMQLAVPGADPHSGDRLPAALRLVLAVEALAAIVVGVLLFASSPSMAADLWAWPLTDLTSKAVGTWLVGTGVTCGMVALLDDRAAMPGWALAQMTLGAAILFGLARFESHVDFDETSRLPARPVLRRDVRHGGVGGVDRLARGPLRPDPGCGRHPGRAADPAGPSV